MISLVAFQCAVCPLIAAESALRGRKQTLYGGHKRLGYTESAVWTNFLSVLMQGLIVEVNLPSRLPCSLRAMNKKVLSPVIA